MARGGDGSSRPRPGGRLAVFTPTYNQLERSVRALREAGFVEVQSTEVLQRALHTGKEERVPISRCLAIRDSSRAHGRWTNVVDVALTYGGIIGVLIGSFSWYWRWGGTRLPKYPRRSFTKRKEFYAYTAGLFVGVPLAFPWLLLLTAAANGADVAALVDIVLLVAGGDIGARECFS